MGFDHFHPCCNVDGRLARLRFLVSELLEIEDVPDRYALVLEQIGREMVNRGETDPS
jgi:hypothetical protein